MEPLQYDVIEAMVQCFGKCFHYKDVMAAFLLSSGTKKSLVDKYKHEAKYVWSRHVLTELNEIDDGCLVQRRILTALCRLRDLPDSAVENKSAGYDALRRLKELAYKYDLIIREEKKEAADKARISQERSKLIEERSAKMESLRKIFGESFSSPNRQAAGYSLQDLLSELFSLFEIEYKKSFRTETQEIDGHFKFESFDYLVEAKWRKDYPTGKDIGGFRYKVETKLESTRGLFVSVVGFRHEVIEEFNGRGSNIILMDGRHLTHILEGRIDLREALRMMISAAAQRGNIYMPIW